MVNQALKPIRPGLDSIGSALDGIELWIMEQKGAIDPLAGVKYIKINATKLLVILKVFDHARNKLVAKLWDETVVIPLIGVEFHTRENSAKIWSIKMMAIQVCIHLLILIANAEDLTGRINR